MDVLGAVFNHLVLPPKLPGYRDGNLNAIEQDILTRLMRACETLRESTGSQFEATWTSVHESLQSCARINVGRLERASLQREFCDLKPDGLLILYVVQQNAALLVRRRVW
jgi:hypothetical protein